MPKQNISVNVNTEKTPILYTDNIFMATNEDGLTLDFGQKVGGTNQVQIVTRVGMSRSHAKKLLKEMGSLLALTEGKKQTGARKE